MEGLVTGSSVLGGIFRGKRVLVTGHTGFKGAWLCSWLLELGAEPSGFALAPSTRPSMFERVGLAERMPQQIGDVRDLEALARFVERMRPDVILHLAAQAIVRESFRLPLETWQTNVIGTAHLLEALRRWERPCVVVVVTSDKCYEPRETGGPFVESDPLGGHDPYSGSKGAAEIVVASYRHSFFPVERYAEHGVALASARAGNVIGGGDWAADRIVPDIVRAVAAGEQPVLRNPAAVRPWQHVLDALSGYLWLAGRMLHGGAAGLAEGWNFGPLEDEALSVARLTDQVLKLWGRDGWQAGRQADAPPEVEFLRLSCAKAVERLGWQPVHDVRGAIAATVAWYRADAERPEMSEVTARQIRDYQAQASAAGLPWARDAGVRAP